MQLDIELYPTGQTLERIASDKKLIIPPLDGKTTIWAATMARGINFKPLLRRIFFGEKTYYTTQGELPIKTFVESDPYFESVDIPGPATRETPVEIYQPAKHAIIRDMFNSLSSDTNALSFTQHQIVEFCRLYQHLLLYKNFFLYKEPSGGINVVQINGYVTELYTHIRSFDSPKVIEAPLPPQRKLVNNGTGYCIYEKIYTPSTLLVIPRIG